MSGSSGENAWHFRLLTTPKSNPSEHYKQAIAFLKLQLCRHCRFRAGSFSALLSRIQVLAHMPCWPPWSFYPKTVEITCAMIKPKLRFRARIPSSNSELEFRARILGSGYNISLYLLFEAKMATQEEMGSYFCSASTNYPPVMNMYSSKPN
jgi:hypothetical protein